MSAPKDTALVKDGVLLMVARAPYGAESFGTVEGAAVVEFDPGDEACPGMLWDGEALSNPADPDPE